MFRKFSEVVDAVYFFHFFNREKFGKRSTQECCTSHYTSFSVHEIKQNN